MNNIRKIFVYANTHIWPWAIFALMDLYYWWLEISKNNYSGASWQVFVFAIDLWIINDILKTRKNK